MRRIAGLLTGLFSDEEGQTLVEYMLVLVLIAIVVILMITTIGGTLNNTYSTVNSSMG